MSFFKRLLRFPFYPLMIGIYAVVFLLSVNLGQVDPEDGYSSIWASLLFSAIVLAVCLLLLRKPHKAGLAAGILVLIFFSFGHIFDLFSNVSIFGIEIGFWKLLAIMGVLVVPALLFIALSKTTFENFTLIGNFSIGVLLVMALAQVISYEVRVARGTEGSAGVIVQQDAVQPDIYYIVLDGYSRSDVLLAREGFDNSAFLAELEARGFTVSDCAFSNYPNTTLSMLSSLNMNYLKALGFGDSDFLLEAGNPGFLTATHHNLVRKEFAARGYQFAAFKGFFSINDIRDADYYFDYSQDQEWSTGLGEGNFQYMAAKTTLLRVLVEKIRMNSDWEVWNRLPLWLYTAVNPNSSQFSSRSYQWYSQHMFALDKLETIPDLPGNVLVYGHLYVTHQPYVLREDGSFLWPINEDNYGYIPAVKYVNKRMLELIDTIVAKSEVPPIIILQGDHGHVSGYGKDRYKILNAFYLPGIEQAPPETMTPVNTFRFLLKHYFNAPYELLPDNVQTVDKNATPVEIRDTPATCDP